MTNFLYTPKADGN